MATVTPSVSTRPATLAPSMRGANFIGGEWIEGQGPALRRLCNPADTTQLVAAVREASPGQVEAACSAAHAAFPGWRATPPPERARVLFRYRELLETHFDEL